MVHPTLFIPNSFTPHLLPPQGVIIIDDIFPEGNAYRDGRLCIGDRILEINDENFTNRTLAEATLALSGVVPLIRLAVLREYLDECE